jgi:hypothetical protein
VGGELAFNLGNGTDTVTVVNAPAGPLSWASGNGNDSLTLAPTVAGQTWTVAVRFGTGDDTFSLAGTATGQILTGLVDGGGRVTANVFQDNPGPWTLEDFTLRNFP